MVRQYWGWLKLKRTGMAAGTSILGMWAVSSIAVIGALHQTRFWSSACHIIKEDRELCWPKVGTAIGHNLCWSSEKFPTVSSVQLPVINWRTIGWISKIFACRSCINCWPGIMTHGSPHSIHTHFHSSLKGIHTTSKSHWTMCAACMRCVLVAESHVILLVCMHFITYVGHTEHQHLHCVHSYDWWYEHMKIG